MAIKKVVLKKKKEEVKYPEFNSNKIYVLLITSDLIYKLLEYDGKYTFARISNGTDSGLTEWNTFLEAIINKNVYILDTQEDLARFIMGCREFPKVEPIEQNVIANDEVSIEDVDINRYIYAELSKYNGIRIFSHYDGKSLLINTMNSYGGKNWISECSIKEAIGYVFNWNSEFYQFDTKKEFLQWSLEQIL